MTDSGVTAQTTDLSGQAPQYQATADQVGQVYRKLSAALDGYGPCWGDDDAGRAFARKYVDPACKALTQMDTANKGLTSMADGVSSWARNYLDTDQQLQADWQARMNESRD
jgi:uncharacterized protein YukE